MTRNGVKTSIELFVKLGLYRILNKRVPLFVSLQITKLCNLKCTYCFAELDSLKKVSDFSTDEWKVIIDQLFNSGTRWIRIQGGEPLIRNDIGELINYIKDKGMICELVTNGLLIEKKINDLKRLDSLCISLDGDREANDLNRGKGVYDKVIKSIDIAKGSGIKIRIHGVLTRNTVNSLDHLATLCGDMNVRFNIAYFLLDDSIEANDIELSSEEIKVFYKNYSDLKKRGFPVSSSYSFINHILNWPSDRGGTLHEKEFRNLSENNLIRCLAGHYTCFIDSDGSLYTCPKRWKKGVNISQGLQKAWDATGEKSCASCWTYGDNEAYAFMNLKLPAIWNILNYFLPFKKVL